MFSGALFSSIMSMAKGGRRRAQGSWSNPVASIQQSGDSEILFIYPWPCAFSRVPENSRVDIT